MRTVLAVLTLSSQIFMKISKRMQGYLDELYVAFSRIKTKKDAALFLEDFLTPRELSDVALRWQLVKRLAKNMPHRSISEELGVSIAKVTRGSKALQNTAGAFSKLLRK